MHPLLEVVRDLKQETATTPKEIFWSVKRSKTNPERYTLAPDNLGWYNYLSNRLNICREKQSDALVRHTGGIVEKIEVPALKRLVLQEIKSFPEVLDGDITRDEIINMVLNAEARLFKEKGALEFLPIKSFDWLKATAEKGYFPYKNGIVEVAAGSVELKPYAEFEGRHVWQGQIIDRDFNKIDPKGGTWADFCYHAAGKERESLDNLIRAIGQNLHYFKQPNKAYLTLLGESVEESRNGGGAGKGLVCKALSLIVPTAWKDMRLASSQDQFPFSMVEIFHNLLVLNDTKPGYSHEQLYNILTEKMEINKKGVAPIILDFEDSPKLIATTNYSLDNGTGHGDRRLRLVELDNFWNKDNTPDKYYGETFFTDWDKEAWGQFDTYMMQAVSQYLREGFPKVAESQSSIRKRVLEKSGSRDLLDWLNYYSYEGFKPFSELYMDYRNSRYITSKPIGKNAFIGRLEDVISIMPGKGLDIAENASIKSLKIW